MIENRRASMAPQGEMRQSGNLNVDLIGEMWEEMRRQIASIKYGEYRASRMSRGRSMNSRTEGRSSLRRLTTANRAGSVPVLPKHHHNTVRIANGEVTNSIGARLQRNRDCRPPIDDLLVERVHILDPEEDAHPCRRAIPLGQMYGRVIPPHHSVVRRLGLRVGLEPQDAAVEVGRGRHIWDQEKRSTLVELLGIACWNNWHCVLLTQVPSSNQGTDACYLTILPTWYL